MFQTTLLVFCAALLQPGLAGGRFEMPFGCQGLISDQTRAGALNLINRIRSTVAEGEFQARAFLPPASDMQKLSWNCALERRAERIVRNCPLNSPPPPRANGLNYRFVGPPSNLRNVLESAILEWTEVPNVMWPNNNVFDGNQASREFANLIRGTQSSVGCSEAFCGNRAAAACLFSLPDVQVGALIYTIGEPCENDGNCIAFFPSFCELGLCVNGERPLTTPSPSTIPITTTTRRRRKSTECQSTAFSAAFRETALGAQNNFRSLVARGQARNAEHPGEFAPPSSRMDLLEYDCTAEQFAHIHVNSCDRQISQPSARPGYEENIHILGTTQTDHLGALQHAIMTWNNELTQNGIPSNMIFTLQLLNRQQRIMSRVSKILWGTNRYVGCAANVCAGFYFISCMYRAPVNIVGQNIYTIGAVCGACLAGPSNCNAAIGLCSW